MDTIDIIVVAFSMLYVSYKVFTLMYARNMEVQAKIDAEIDRLHK